MKIDRRIGGWKFCLIKLFSTNFNVMAEVTKTEKLLLSQKLLDFQRSGFHTGITLLIN
jgi:hypothetical protein